MDRRTFLSSTACALPAAAVPVASASAAATRTRIYVGDTAPYSFTGANGAPAGVAYEMVELLAQDLQVDLEPLVAPLVRAFKETESKGRALIIPPARIPSREKLVQWVAPLVPIRLMMFARRGSSYDIASIASAKDLEVGILSAPGLEEAYRSAGFQRVKRLPSNEAAIRMLMNDRLPAVLTADCSVYNALKEAGISGTEVREGVVLSAVTLWLAASMDFPEAELRQWQSAAERHKAALARILAKYV